MTVVLVCFIILLLAIRDAALYKNTRSSLKNALNPIFRGAGHRFEMPAVRSDEEESLHIIFG